MKTKSKIEVSVVMFFTFAIVIVAPMVFKHIGNDILKMSIKPLLYILLVGTPFIVCKIMKSSIGTLGFRKGELLKQLLIGVEIFMVLAFFLTIAVFILGNNKGMLLSTKENRIGIIVYYIIFDMLFVGMGEEMLFRGYFMERFHTMTNSGTWAVAISALMFGIWHFPNGQDFLQVILTALIGVILGLAKLKIKNCSTLSLGIAHGLHDVYILILSCILL
ncbi:CPBP family intramembrane glutamic endopeptidase [Acetobacterium paludosum]|nr:type II CAAX endopeptidase family protein [Acetobacterium paludosum]